MIFFILIAVAVCVVGYFTYDSYKCDGFGYSIFVLFMCGMLSLAGAAILFLLSVFTAVPFFGESVATSYQLRAVSNNSSSSGVFILGSGGYGEDLVYRYAWEDDHGRIFLEEVEADGVWIMEDSTPENAHMLKTNKVLDAWWFAPFKVTLGTEDQGFHVPKGSVVENYSVDVDK